MKSLPKTKTPGDLRQVSITTHPGAEEAVTALVGRVGGQTPSVYSDMATGPSTVSVHPPLPAAPGAAPRGAGGGVARGRGGLCAPGSQGGSRPHWPPGPAAWPSGA